MVKLTDTTKLGTNWEETKGVQHCGSLTDWQQGCNLSRWQRHRCRDSLAQDSSPWALDGDPRGGSSSTAELALDYPISKKSVHTDATAKQTETCTTRKLRVDRDYGGVEDLHRSPHPRDRRLTTKRWAAAGTAVGREKTPPLPKANESAVWPESRGDGFLLRVIAYGYGALVFSLWRENEIVFLFRTRHAYFHRPTSAHNARIPMPQNKATSCLIFRGGVLWVCSDIMFILSY
jgi:hypothetical protein